MKITGFALLATIAGLPLASCGNLRAATECDLAQPPKLNVGWWLHANPDTKCPKGKVVINVNRKVIDGMDSGLGDNYCGARWWGMSTFAQTIKVVEVDTDVYCATVYTTGEVTSVGGDGPGCGLDGEPQCGESEGYLQQGVVAPFSGGYTMTIESALKAKDEITANMLGPFRRISYTANQIIQFSISKEVLVFCRSLKWLIYSSGIGATMFPWLPSPYPVLTQTWSWYL